MAVLLVVLAVAFLLAKAAAMAGLGVADMFSVAASVEAPKVDTGRMAEMEWSHPAINPVDPRHSMYEV